MIRIKECLAVLEENDFFGEQSLLMNRPAGASVRTISYCELAALKASDFAEVVKSFPSLGEIINQIAQEIE